MLMPPRPVLYSDASSVRKERTTGDAVVGSMDGAAERGALVGDEDGLEDFGEPAAPPPAPALLEGDKEGARAVGSTVG